MKPTRTTQHILSTPPPPPPAIPLRLRNHARMQTDIEFHRGVARNEYARAQTNIPIMYALDRVTRELYADTGLP